MAIPRKVDWSTAYACQALRLSMTLAAALGLTPQLRLFESNICRSYYRRYDPSAIDATDNITEELCKIAGVQQSVSDVNGLLSGLTVFPTLLAVLPYLILHRLANQKILLLVNVFGILVMNIYYCAILYFYNFFDPRWICVVAFGNFIGGGYPVFNSLLAASIAKSVPQNSLSTFQLHYSALALLVKLAGSAIGLSMMKVSVWLPVILALVIHVLAIPVVYIFFKDPSRSSASDQIEQHGLKLLPDDEEDESSSSSESEMKFEHERQPLSKKILIRKTIRQFKGIFPYCTLPMAVVTLHYVGDSVRQISPYWMSRRYHWELREVGWVQFCESLFTATLMALLPSLAKRLLRRSPVSLDSSHDGELGTASYRAIDQDSSSSRRDLDLAKLCVLFAGLGTALLGLSWYRFSAFVSLAVMAGGAGFQDAYHSYLASQIAVKPVSRVDDGIKASDLAAVYMVLSLISMTASNMGGWIVNKIYSAALRSSGDSKESWSTSLPIWFCSLAFVGCWWFLRRCRRKADAA